MEKLKWMQNTNRACLLLHIQKFTVCLLNTLISLNRGLFVLASVIFMFVSRSDWATPRFDGIIRYK